jgi:hypothetical protein
MSVTVHASARGFARGHPAALAIVVLCTALAATLGLLLAGIGTESPSIPVSSVSTVHLQPTDNGCQLARPGRPC